MAKLFRSEAWYAENGERIVRHFYDDGTVSDRLLEEEAPEAAPETEAAPEVTPEAPVEAPAANAEPAPEVEAPNVTVNTDESVTAAPARRRRAAASKE